MKYILILGIVMIIGLVVHFITNQLAFMAAMNKHDEWRNRASEYIHKGTERQSMRLLDSADLCLDSANVYLNEARRINNAVIWIH